MSVTITARFSVYGNNYEDLVEATEERISTFFEVNISDVKKKFNYELIVEEGLDVTSEAAYEAVAIVRKRDV